MVQLVFPEYLSISYDYAFNELQWKRKRTDTDTLKHKFEGLYLRVLSTFYNTFIIMNYYYNEFYLNQAEQKSGCNNHKYANDVIMEI